MSSKTTVKSAGATMSRAPLSSTSMRLLGAIITFVGILLCLEKRGILNMAVTVIGVALVVGGFFVAISNLRRLFDGRSGKDTILYFLFGLVAFIGGVVLLIYRGQIQSWFLLALGGAIALYGLAMLLYFLLRKRTRSAFSLVIAALTIVVGILVALLYVPEIANAENGLCFYIFGGFATLVGAIELLIY